MILNNPEKITTEWLTHVLHKNAAIPNSVRVKTVVWTEEIMVNCRAYYLTAQYTGIEAPKDLTHFFLKIPNPDVDHSNQEGIFYTSIAPCMLAANQARDWPFLRCYDVVVSPETGESHFLFEDLTESHFTLQDLFPAEKNHRDQVIDAFAQLHAFWWEHPRLGQDVGELLSNEKIDRFLYTVQKRYPQLLLDMNNKLHPSQEKILRKVTEMWPERRRNRVVAGKGITIVHRDPHPRNFLYPRNEKVIVKLIDWQSWRVDTGTDDLAYLMACQWPLEARIQMESALIERYYKQLISNGVKNYSWEECVYDYKASIIRCLFFLITAWSPKQWDRIARGLEAYIYWECDELFKR
jgi:thiamine kinase-like enzyme